MKILDTGYKKVEFTYDEIIEQNTKVVIFSQAGKSKSQKCVPWIEDCHYLDKLVELGCKCGHCNTKRVSLIQYIK
ncbi:hypothetical protein LCGC14_1881150 [marine sediment metagenome]|uniref:Uncharacterized protein n=1 Tax=marine sediment metagenome TaxID=412755 RepID=A0A0F9GQJ0_9ZZZZ